MCNELGYINPGVEVHHKVELTPENINDPSVALSWDNLQVLCEMHHHMIHNAKRRKHRMYCVDAYGNMYVFQELERNTLKRFDG